MKNTNVVLNNISASPAKKPNTWPKNAPKPCPPPPKIGQGKELLRRKDFQWKIHLGAKKSLSSPLDPALTEDCNETIGALAELRLNASTLSGHNSLTLRLTSDLIPNSYIITLIDSRSTHCFLDSNFISKHNLHTRDIRPILLQLFDGSSNSDIWKSIDLQLWFPTKEMHAWCNLLRNSVRF